MEHRLRMITNILKIGLEATAGDGLECFNSHNYGRFENLLSRLSTRLLSQWLIVLSIIAQREMEPRSNVSAGFGWGFSLVPSH